MSLIWWIMPSIAAVTGFIFLFAGAGKLAGLRPMAGLVRLVFASGFMGLAGLVAFVGLNIQTYERLTYERAVATVRFAAVAGQPDTYTAELTFADGSRLLQADGTHPVFRGDEWQIGARVIRFRPMANILGYDSIYRLEHIRALDSGQFSADQVSEGRVDGLRIVPSEPGIDVAGLAGTYGSRFGIDAEYGSATYQPMGDGYEYEVSITQDALIARPTEATRALIEARSLPALRPVPGGSE